MTEPNRKTNQESDAKRATAAKARSSAAKATAPASQATKSAASKATGAATAAKNGVERSAEATSGAVQSAAQGAVRGVEASRQAIVTTSGHVAATAKTAWTVIAHRKLVAAGAAAGLSALTAASYAVGRRSGRHTHGPITRLTGGRI